MIIWNADLEKVADFMKAYSKHQLFFYGITITKSIGIGFVVWRPRVIIEEVDECPNCHFEYQPDWDECPNCKYVRNTGG